MEALIAPLERQPVVLGKPHQPMLDVIVDKCVFSFVDCESEDSRKRVFVFRYNLDPNRTCMIGDR